MTCLMGTELFGIRGVPMIGGLPVTVYPGLMMAHSIFYCAVDAIDVGGVHTSYSGILESLKWY